MIRQCAPRVSYQARLIWDDPNRMIQFARVLNDESYPYDRTCGETTDWEAHAVFIFRWNAEITADPFEYRICLLEYN